MKARVKDTGVELEVHLVNKQAQYKGSDGIIYWEEDLDFNIEDNNILDYWTRLEHQYAGMAMQGIVSSYEAMREISKERDIPQYVANMAFGLAHALVEKMKEERK